MFPYAQIVAVLLLMQAVVPVPARSQSFDVQTPAPVLQIVVNVEEGVIDRRFMTELEDRLRAMFMAPVQVRPMALHKELLQTGLEGRVDAAALLDALAAFVDWEREVGAYHVLLIMPEMRLAPDRFNFSVSMGGLGTRSRVGVVSLARLQKLGGDRLDDAPHRTAARVHKLIARSIVMTSGYPDTRSCLHHVPRSLAVLDALPESYCEPDLANWTAAGLLRPPRD